MYYQQPYQFNNINVDDNRYILTPDIQNNLHQAIHNVPVGQTKKWNSFGHIFHFVAESHLYYSSYNRTPCRQGTLYRSANGTMGPWDNIKSTFCKVGPNGEWLPTT